MKQMILALFIATFSTSALANDAGCGLGSLVIQKNTKLSQSLAITTNASFLSNFLGITSGTSNCSANGFAFNNKEATMFAEANLPSLKVEMARGQGENLSAFSQVMGCKDSAAFSKMTKSSYQNIFPTTGVGAHQMLDNVKSEIQKDEQLKQGCIAAS